MMTMPEYSDALMLELFQAAIHSVIKLSVSRMTEKTVRVIVVFK